MIEFTKSYKTGDGEVFGTIEEAQAHEIEAIFLKEPLSKEPTFQGDVSPISKIILANKNLLIDILTMTPNSKPKARASHGGTKNRKKTVITDAATSVGSALNT